MSSKILLSSGEVICIANLRHSSACLLLFRDHPHSRVSAQLG
jgi:hypothetical protein